MTDESHSEPGHGTAEGHAAVSHAADGHASESHAAEEDHGHAASTLGPIDWGAWAYALVGGAAGLLVVAVFWVAVK